MKSYWPDNEIYFVTGSTFLHYPYFSDYPQKLMVLTQIKKVKQNLRIPVLAYSIAINHYHLKVYLKNGTDLSKIKQLIHGGVSFKYRKNYKLKYQEMWQSSRAIVISSDDMDWKTTGYTIGNLLKHKEVSTFKELENNPFSSYWHFKKIHGDEETRQLVYSVIDINEDAEGKVDFRKLNKIYAPLPSTPLSCPPLAEVEG